MLLSVSKRDAFSVSRAHSLGKENAESVTLTGYRKMMANASGTLVNIGGEYFLCFHKFLFCLPIGLSIVCLMENRWKTTRLFHFRNL